MEQLGLLGDDLESNLQKILHVTNELLEYPSSQDFSFDRLLMHIDSIEQMVAILYNIPDYVQLSSNDEKLLHDLTDEMTQLNDALLSYYYHKSSDTTSCSQLEVQTLVAAGPGRPRYVISKSILEELRGLGFSWIKISKMFGVSRWTISRRVEEYGLEIMQAYSLISDDEIDSKVKDFISRHGSTTGEPLLSGYFRSQGLFIQRRRIRASLNRVDPRNTALRWGALVTRRTYYVPWPNSLWHIDGHHSLIRWKFVVHGCIDGKSRKIMFLRCSTNNLAETVLELFLQAISQHNQLWPSRIRVDYGVENTRICEAMIENRGEGRGSFIAGASTRNQRIERLWRDVFRCVSLAFYYAFYAMEQSSLLDVENPVHLLALHLVYLPRINMALEEFMKMYNDHRLSTENNWTPNQIWYNGMMNEGNPLRVNATDENIDDLEFYGEDPRGPFPVGDRSNNVTISAVTIPFMDEVIISVSSTLEVEKESSEMGIDIYAEALTLIVQKLEELGI